MKELSMGFLLIFILLSCGAESGMSKEPTFIAARQCADSCQAFLPKMMTVYDSILPTNEWEALKIKNNHDMTKQNLGELELLLDSMEHMAPGSPELANFEALVTSQTQYLYSLLASGNAILSHRSQSFGQWQQAPTALPDSVMSPVQ